jgi:hypothetical protein
MPLVGFEPTTPVFERAKTVHAVDHTTTVIGYITSADTNKLKWIQHKFTHLSFNRFSPEVRYIYAVAIKQLKLNSLHLRALLLIQVHFGSKFCSSVLGTFGLRAPAWHVTDYSIFNVWSSSKNCPSGRFASAANVACSDADVFETNTPY